MGNKVSRRRDAQDTGAETAATEQQSAEQPAATELAEEPGMIQSHEATETEDLDVVVGEPVMLVDACLPNEECISKFKEVPAATQATQNDTEQDPVAKEAPLPVQCELLLSVGEPTLKSEPVAEAQLAPEPVPEPEPTSNQDTEIEAVSEPISQASLPEPVLSSLPSISLGAPDVNLQPANSPPTPATICTQVNADKPSDILVSEEWLDHAKAAKISMFASEEPEETSESLEEPMGATEDLEQLVSDVKDDGVGGLLKNLEMDGNYTDLIPGDVVVP
ncbi:hypothetical protein EXN66_Car004584 [Channa argus]|uniref:Uncharacterized protein n=1 Tax=Channa argus TaxID=215402 RepID=A0A6G1PF96_CHAAH|nr:hypothetical protein EXN66_Car004584 [Channa argus]KAK2917935.1 hypothetical protein Q8A73_004681 [Channa argus]